MQFRLENKSIKLNILCNFKTKKDYISNNLNFNPINKYLRILIFKRSRIFFYHISQSFFRYKYSERPFIEMLNGSVNKILPLGRNSVASKFTN